MSGDLNLNGDSSTANEEVLYRSPQISNDGLNEVIPLLFLGFLV